MKYIDADRLKEEFQKRFDICKRVSEDDRNALDTQDWYRGKYTAYSECLSFIDSLQQEQPKEICSKCIHHGKDDDYCYNPRGGMQSLINENGVYECTGFCEKEEQPEVDLEEAAEEKYPVYWKNYPKDGIVRSESAYDTNKQCRDAFIAGAEWQKKRFEAEYELDWLTDLKKDLYELGRKDEREQMMKEAMEARIYGYGDGSFELVASWLDMPKNSIYKDGQNVRIIIVKEGK